MGTQKEALQYAVELAAPQFHKDAAGNEWCNKSLNPVRANLPDALGVNTLTALADLVTNGFENFDKANALVHVNSHESVELVARSSDPWGRRQIFVTASVPETDGFSFGAFLEHEMFLIGLLANFTATPDRDYLASIASNIEAGRARSSQDNGVAQEVTMKQGVSLKTSAVVKNRLVLAPYRTFREVEQPASEFLFRVRGGTDTAPPTLALYEADGGKWMIDAMENIGRYLRTTLKLDIPVVI